MSFTQVWVVCPEGFTLPNKTSARPLPCSWLQCVMCRMAGRFSWLQLMVYGKLLTSTRMVLGLALYTCFSKSSSGNINDFRSTASRPSLGTGQKNQSGRVP